MTRVAVIGHVEWVDFIPVDRFPVPGQVVHAEGAFSRAGGGGGVVSTVLAELDAEIDFFCALGRDAHGEAAVDQLTERGVHMHVVWRSEPTRRAVTLLDPSGDRTIVTVGERLQPLGSDDLDWEALRAVDGVFFTAGDRSALEWARVAPVLVASPRARAALDGEGPTVDALVFSAHDQDESQWARRLAPRAALLVETRSEAGGRWWGQSSQGSWSAAPLPSVPRDAYGCGDSFVAGLTFALASGNSIADACALGARLGARALTRVGAP
jgi:ribokinase